MKEEPIDDLRLLFLRLIAEESDAATVLFSLLRECRVVNDWHRWTPHAPEGELEWVTATKAAVVEGEAFWPDELPF